MNYNHKEHKLLTEEEIYKYFDVEHIKILMNYSMKRNPIRKDVIISKPLFESFEVGYESYKTEDVEAQRGSVEPDSKTIEIPKELYDELIRLKENKDKKNTTNE